MKITMVGTGYVGLVTGTCLAESGNEVVCVDKDERKLATLESGGLPISSRGCSSWCRATAARAVSASRATWPTVWHTGT
jgi:UDPglucose 6-dehydrogenase